VTEHDDRQDAGETEHDDEPCPECGTPVLDIDMKCRGCGASLASTGARRMVGQVVLENYQIEDVVGQGGMAIVYAARHRVTGQEVALKVLTPELARDRAIQGRFLEEARALAQLDHPNIVHLYTFGEDGGCLVLAMQLVRGETWERLILAGDLGWPRSAAIAIDVTRALEVAHRRGIVHRDMKPSNVLVRAEDGLAMVMDFGIAKSEGSSRLTETGQTMGTVRYMAPEQVRGKAVDPRTDIYALGVALYESLAGHTPFDGDTAFDIMSAHLQEAPPRLSLPEDAPAPLADLVHWMIAKRPDDRPPDAAAVRRALEEILAGEKPAVPRPPARSAPTVIEGRGRGKQLAIAGAAATAVAITAIAAIGLLGSEEPAPSPPPRPVASPAEPAGAPALPTDLDPGHEADYVEERLLVRAASADEAEALRRIYRGGVARWRRHLADRGLAGRAELRGEMPRLTLLSAPGHQLCDRTAFDSDRSWNECLDFGVYVASERTMLVPAGTRYLELAIHSAIALAYCGAHPSPLCEGEARRYMATIFAP
jgi:serine/threonine-protein kinase